MTWYDHERGDVGTAPCWNRSIISWFTGAVKENRHPAITMPTPAPEHRQAMVDYLNHRRIWLRVASHNGWYPSRDAGDTALRIVIPCTETGRGRFWQARLITGGKECQSSAPDAAKNAGQVSDMTKISSASVVEKSCQAVSTSSIPSDLRLKSEPGKPEQRHFLLGEKAPNPRLLTPGNTQIATPRWESPHGPREDALLRLYTPHRFHGRPLVVVEGPFDAAVACGHGFDAVALLGNTPPKAVLEHLCSIMKLYPWTAFIADADALDSMSKVMYNCSGSKPVAIGTTSPAKDLADADDDLRERILSWLK
jgi:hypothetical protein